MEESDGVGVETEETGLSEDLADGEGLRVVLDHSQHTRSVVQTSRCFASRAGNYFFRCVPTKLDWWPSLWRSLG